MTGNLLPGIRARTIGTSRLRANVLERCADGALRPPAPDGAPAPAPRPTVVFVHGNVSSSLFWQPAMLALPEDVRPIAVDLRGFGDSEALPVDATRGVRDFADDMWSVIDALLHEDGLDPETPVHLAGWSLGGPVVLQQLLDRPDRVASLALVATVSPFGLGGSTGADGQRITDDDAGCGAGAANPGFVTHLREGDRTADHRSSPRSAFRATYVAPGYRSDDEDIWVESILSTRVAEGGYPGDSVPSIHWPGFAPGVLGPLNAMTPRYLDVSRIDLLDRRPPILWVRGTQDVIVSDSSVFDVNALGASGRMSGWPGPDRAPVQPMLTQIRTMLDAYAAAGGSYRELALEQCGHSPQIERTAEFSSALASLIRLSGRADPGASAQR